MIELEKIKLLHIGIFFGNSNMFNGSLVRFQNFLQKKLMEIPEQYRDSAEIYFSSELVEDSVNMDIMYYRPETDEEYNLRMIKLIEQHDFVKRQEYKRYLKLKEKFEGIKDD